MSLKAAHNRNCTGPLKRLAERVQWQGIFHFHWPNSHEMQAAEDL
jgi:hypothetical protein